MTPPPPLSSSSSSSSSLPKENLPATNPKFYEKAPISICKFLIQQFSTNTKARSIDRRNQDQDAVEVDSFPIHVRLITIGPSHFCEKARWALDILETNKTFYYTEDAHPPIFAGIATLEASNGEASMTPMTVYDKHQNLNHQYSNNMVQKVLHYDSSNIIQHFCPHLYPSSKKQEIIQLESYLGTHLGATARVLFYHYMFQPSYKRLLCKSITVHSSWIETLLWNQLYDRGIKEGMKKAMKINEESAKLSLETIRQVFHEVSERLKADNDDRNHHDNDNGNSSNGNRKGRMKKEYLLDTKNERIGFTAADLTFAALASPLILPPEMAPIMDVTNDEKYPKELVDLKYELRETLAGQHVLEMYKKHRLVCEASRKKGMIVPKVMGRNRIPPLIQLVVGFTVASLGISKIIDNRRQLRSRL